MEERAARHADGSGRKARSSLISRSWKVPQSRSTRPLACGERARIS